jgi:hypothetical protein
MREVFNMRQRGKKFLSESHEEGDSISWYVRTDLEYLKKYEASVKLTDCYETITLEFDCWKSSDFEKRVLKVSTLIKELTLFRAALVEATDEIKKPKKFYY